MDAVNLQGLWTNFPGNVTIDPVKGRYIHEINGQKVFGVEQPLVSGVPLLAYEGRLVDEISFQGQTTKVFGIGSTICSSGYSGQLTSLSFPGRYVDQIRRDFPTFHAGKKVFSIEKKQCPRDEPPPPWICRCGPLTSGVVGSILNATLTVVQQFGLGCTCFGSVTFPLNGTLNGAYTAEGTTLLGTCNGTAPLGSPPFIAAGPVRVGVTVGGQGPFSIPAAASGGYCPWTAGIYFYVNGYSPTPFAGLIANFSFSNEQYTSSGVQFDCNPFVFHYGEFIPRNLVGPVAVGDCNASFSLTITE